MKVSLAFVDEDHQIWHKLDIPDGCTLKQVIIISGILEDMPEIDLEVQKVGIHGKIADLTDSVKEGDRIEIYRPITADPAQVKRRSVPVKKA